MFSLYKIAERRKKQSKYDIAALVLYRILELVMQRRIALYGINPDNPDYSNTGIPADKLLEDFERKRMDVFKKSRHGQRFRQLPSAISLMDGYIMLSALCDRISPNLGHLNRVIAERNKGLLAHGFKPITEKDLKKFQDLADNIIGQFCEVECIDRKAELPAFEFCCLPESESLWSFIK